MIFDFQALKRPTETSEFGSIGSDATVAVAPDLWVGRRFLRTKCPGRGKLFPYLCKPQYYTMLPHKIKVQFSATLVALAPKPD